MALWTIRAECDPEAEIWWTSDSDIPGLAADAATLDELTKKIGVMLPDLLGVNADQLPYASRREGPHRLRIIADHERLFDVAAWMDQRSVVVDNGMTARRTANAVLKQAGIKMKF